MTDERPQTKPFAAWLQEQRGGALHGELSDALAELVASAIEHQRGGQLTLTVKVAPNKDGVTLLVADDVKSKLPAPDRAVSLFFADDRGNLSRRDPRQSELPLREAPRPPEEAEPKEATS